LIKDLKDSVGHSQPSHPPLSASSAAETLKERLVARSCIVALLILSFVLAFRQIDSVDIGLHLAPGHWMLENRSFPKHDLFTFTVADNPYVDTYWFYQVFLAALDIIGGSTLLIAANALAVCMSITLMIFRSRLGGSIWPSAFPILLFVAVYTLNYEIRPHVFSWIYLGGLLYYLEREEIGEGKRFYAVTGIMLLWANTQPTFVLGWVAIGCHLIGLFMKERKGFLRRCLPFAGAIAVCFANPYFERGVFLPFTQFGFLSESSVFKHLIAEYNPLPLVPREADYAFLGKVDFSFPIFILQLFRIFLIAAVIVQSFRKRISIHQSILSGLLFYLSLLAEKNIGYFVVAIVPIVIRSLVYSPERPRSRWKYISMGAALVVVLSCLDLTIRVVSNDYYSVRRLHFRFGAGYNNLSLPVKATDFLITRNLQGRMMNHINFGGYLMYKLGPNHRIFIDGRNEVIGENFAEEYLQTNENKTIGNVVRKYQPELAIFPHKEALSWVNYFMHDTTNWRLVYFDELAAIYLRKGYANEVPSFDPSKDTSLFNKLSRKELNALLQKKVTRPFLDKYLKKQYYPVSESERAVFSYYNGWISEAISFTVTGLNRSTVDCPELYLNLAIYFLALGDVTNTRICLDRFEEGGYRSASAVQIRSLLR